VPLFIGDSVEPYLEAYRQRIALYVGGMGARNANFYNDLAVRYGYVDEAERVQELYLAGEKAAAAAVLPEELLTSTALIGTEAHVRERLAAFKESGATTIIVMPLAQTSAARIESVEAARAMLNELG
jgi:alkanesulfonate monooxygenase SsuD/methylene tetrahydromethanopterin reductase-like flavin-dependent oxidoreductase (luciferase family)